MKGKMKCTVERLEKGWRKAICKGKMKDKQKWKGGRRGKKKGEP